MFPLTLSLAAVTRNRLETFIKCCIHHAWTRRMSIAIAPAT